MLCKLRNSHTELCNFSEPICKFTVTLNYIANSPDKISARKGEAGEILAKPVHIKPDLFKVKVRIFFLMMDTNIMLTS